MNGRNCARQGLASPTNESRICQRLSAFLCSPIQFMCMLLWLAVISRTRKALLQMVDSVLQATVFCSSFSGADCKDGDGAIELAMLPLQLMQVVSKLLHTCRQSLQSNIVACSKLLQLLAHLMRIRS